MFNSFPSPKPDSGGGNNIKSIQRGSTTVSAGANSNAATISAIDPTKSIIIISNSGAGASINDQGYFQADIINATTITFTRTIPSNNVSIEWTVVEYTSVKSLQKGTTSVGSINTPVTATVSSVNTQKSLLYISFNTTAGSSVRQQISYVITNSTTLTFVAGVNGAIIVAWQLIEFP